MIKLNELTKQYGKLVALDKVTLTVHKGELFGILGPNGAGKTTLLSMLTTLVKPTKGTAQIDTYDVIQSANNVRKRIGVVFQESVLDEEFSAYDNLKFHAELHSIPNKDILIKEKLELVGLAKKADVKVKTYSGGMKRRLEIARALLHNPQVLLMDEPTLGLDPAARKDIWEYIQKINQENKTTIILNTHYLEEADELCSRIAILDAGKLVAINTPQKLKKEAKTTNLYDVFRKFAGREIT